MLERVSPAVRHFLLMLFASSVAVLGPFLTTHQSEFSVYVADRLRLPVWAVPLIASVIGSLILRFTTLTRQYGVGSTVPPLVPAPAVVVPAPPVVTGDVGPVQDTPPTQ